MAVTDVVVQPERVSVGVDVVVLVTVRNTQSVEDSRLIELEVDGEVVDTFEVSIPAESESTIQFIRRIGTPGTYTLSVDGETASVTVVESSPTATSTTSTEFPGFGAALTVVALMLAALYVTRQD